VQGKIIEFLRKRDYKYEKDLGQGACGKTVLLRDDMIDEYFVCKKYSPFSETHRQELYTNFVREIKLLHQVYHPNVVRVFNYYLYPEHSTGYILMEFVDGFDIEEYIKNSPEMINEIFQQVVSGFKYLEANNILHRDIRPLNILVTNTGNVKIIDLGFGKRVKTSKDFDKSISLNWWCEPPEDFINSVYDFRTEVYFIGKLFEKMIQEIGVKHFAYNSILNAMCSRNPTSRLNSFLEAEKEINNNRFFEIDFNDEELHVYRDFADKIATHTTKIESGSKYRDDLNQIQSQLEDANRSFMLEETVPDSSLIINCFINGAYYYKKTGLAVWIVRNFLRLFKSVSQEKQRIIIANIHTRLDAIPRYEDVPLDDDIPF
jgi:serine/threonine-protein kinase